MMSWRYSRRSKLIDSVNSSTRGSVSPLNRPPQVLLIVGPLPLVPCHWHGGVLIFLQESRDKGKRTAAELGSVAASARAEPAARATHSHSGLACASAA